MGVSWGQLSMELVEFVDATVNRVKADLSPPTGSYDMNRHFRFLSRFITSGHMFMESS